MGILTSKKRIEIVDKALREHYRLTMEAKRVPNDYMLMFTEGGETDAVASAIEEATIRKVEDNVIAFIRETELIAQDDYDLHFKQVWLNFKRTGEVPEY